MKSLDIVGGSIRILFKNLPVFFIASLIWIFAGLLVIPNPPLFFGLFYIANKAVKGDKPMVGDVFRGFDYFVKSWIFIIALTIILGILIGWVVLLAYLGAGQLTLGIVSLFVFIIMISIALSSFYFIPIIIEEDCGVVKAIFSSMHIFKKNITTTIIVACVISVIQWVLALTVVGIGLLYTLPAIAYTKIALDSE